MKNERGKYLIFFLCMIFSFLVGSLVTFGEIILFDRIFEKNTINYEKEANLENTSIAIGVAKIYDSVVVIESYKDSNLIRTGTGFIYSKDDSKYYIVTNYHVIEGANIVKIILTNNMKFDVNIESCDQFSDIVVLSYKTDKNLVIASLGESIKTKVGDTVFAIGSPLDSSIYSWSVTRGILSGKDREVRVSSKISNKDWIINVLQMDASINSGNSGGPLCNSNGEVIGITNMKLDGVEGIGFAIPIEDAKKVIDNLIAGKELVKPYIGIDVIDASNIYNQNFYNLSKDNYGAYITSVEANSPGEESGIQKGDVLIAINDKKIENVSMFRYELYKYEVGSELSVTVLRNDRKLELKVMLEKAE